MKRNKPSLDISKCSAIRFPLLKSSLLCNYVLVRFSCSSGDIRDSDALSSSNLSHFIPRLERSSIVRPPYRRYLRVEAENVRRKFLRLADRNLTSPMRRSTTTSTSDLFFAHKVYNDALCPENCIFVWTNRILASDRTRASIRLFTSNLNSSKRASFVS